MRFLFLLWYCFVKNFNIIIQFLLKISLIWWDKFIFNFKYIFSNKIGSIKNKCNSCGQINKKLSFTGGGLCGAPRSKDEVRKFSPSCRIGREWNKIKLCGVRAKISSFWLNSPHSIAIRKKIIKKKYSNKYKFYWWSRDKFN